MRSHKANTLVFNQHWRKQTLEEPKPTTLESTLSIYRPEVRCPLPSKGQLLTTESSHFSVDGASSSFLDYTYSNLVIIPPLPIHPLKLEETVVANPDDLTSTVQGQFIWNFLDKNVRRINEPTSTLFLLWFKESSKLREQKDDNNDFCNFGILTKWDSKKRCVAN